MNETEILRFLRKINDGNYWSLEETIQIIKKEKTEVKESLDQITRSGYLEYKKDLERWTISFRGKIKAQQRVKRMFNKQSIRKGLQQVMLNAEELNQLEEFYISVKGIKVDSLTVIPENSSQLTLIYTIEVEKKDLPNLYQLASSWAYQQNYSYSNPIDMLEFPYKFVRNKLKSGSHMFAFKQVEEKEYQKNSGLEIFKV